MTHKVHPKSFRIKEIEDWSSRGFYERKFTSQLEEDFRLREFLKKKIGKFGVEKIEIERFPGKITVIISSARPGLLIGRGGGTVEEIKKELGNKIVKQGQELKIEILEVRNPWTSAALSAQWIADQIGKRVRFRRVLKQSLGKIMAQKGIKGARVEVAGRLDGIEIARDEWLSKGRLPRQTLRADIDYAQDQAYCSYGVIGIKVWIYKGDKF